MYRGARSAANRRTAVSQRLARAGVAQEQDEIVSTDVTEKVAAAIAGLRKNARRQLNHIVAAAVSVRVVERLEVVQVAVTGDEAHSGL